MSPIADPEQRRAYQREWARKRRQQLLGEDACCLRCGATDDLHLHHLVPSEKDTHRITTWALERAEREASKCVVLCASCHRLLHADERKSPCGTTSGYRRGCRCGDCRRAHRDAAREYKEAA